MTVNTSIKVSSNHSLCETSVAVHDITEHFTWKTTEPLFQKILIYFQENSRMNSSGAKEWVRPLTFKTFSSNQMFPDKIVTSVAQGEFGPLADLDDNEDGITERRRISDNRTIEFHHIHIYLLQTFQAVPELLRNCTVKSLYMVYLCVKSNCPLSRDEVSVLFKEEDFKDDLAVATKEQEQRCRCGSKLKADLHDESEHWRWMRNQNISK
ncbi:MAG: hypothetical protein EOP48_06025 [Sphingobacteriales bacterium]|nr:MAG: hypothetical protein EOP48_06025 [Sphingobacteriales bacterium]